VKNHLFRHPEKREPMGRRDRKYILSEFTQAKLVREPSAPYRLAWDQCRREVGFAIRQSAEV
jgi:hypothetical protein